MNWKPFLEGENFPPILGVGLVGPSLTFIFYFVLGHTQKEFRNKNMLEWSPSDVCDWLDSLFLSEYKVYKLTSHY